METLTSELVDAHMMSFIEIMSEAQADGVTRYAWALSPMAGEPASSGAEDHEWSFEYSSHDAARNFALGWLRRNRPELERAAVKEAWAGIRYRATQGADAPR